MRKRFWLGALVGIAAMTMLGAGAHAHAAGPDAEPIFSDPQELAVREALQSYLVGHATGRGDVMAGAFVGGARLSTVVNGKLEIRDATDYLADFTGLAAADETERRRWIQSIDIVGEMALARVVQLYPGVRFVDYLVLHRVGDDWKIVHQAYHAEPR